MDLLSIKDPSFIKELNIKELKELASDIRKFIIENVSKTGGHLSSNLGVVEITIAYYYVFDYKENDFIFDVGHQSYVHKILTGRAKDFTTLRSFNGMSGYIRREESELDVWESGHSSTSISASTGRTLAGNKREVVLIGDSSISNGVAFEGLNFLGQYKNLEKAPIIILNDNKMGISKSVGALSKSLFKLRSNRAYEGFKALLHKVLPGFLIRFCHRIKRSLKGFVQTDNIFEDMGFDYYGPYDGNDLKTLIKVFKNVKENNEPIVVHLHTIKGKGYKFSEEDESGSFHGVPPFDIETGKKLNKDDTKISYSEVVSNYLLNKRENKEFYCITPAMKSGAYLDEFSKKYPNSFIDVGIQEEHSAVLSAGIASLNKDVVLLMYSTFAQRAYDEILNDIARNNYKVIIGIDRAGIVGEDGVTHQGLYDVSMFMSMPNMVIAQGRNAKETIGLFNYAFNNNKPMVIRYPRASVLKEEFDFNYVCECKWDILNNGKKLAVIGYGDDIERINNLTKELDIMVIDAKFIRPIDINTLDYVFNNVDNIIVIEQVIANGTLYHEILDYKETHNYKSKVIKHSFNNESLIPHGKKNEVLDAYGFGDKELIDLINKYME